MGRTDLVQHYIDVGNTKPIHQKPYRLPPALNEDLDQELNDMLREGEGVLSKKISVHGLLP